VRDDGPGIADPEAALAGRTGGVGLHNGDSRLRQTFGPEYGLTVESRLGGGTSVALMVPKFRAGVRAA
jgi:two-component system, LytTR family, sensor kinase